jgi:hypothetical protein
MLDPAVSAVLRKIEIACEIFLKHYFASENIQSFPRFP